mmetsp:Transcript_39284/g.111049  ORF Transcript_39284/g.111049 Transcript_39284/m.111049 type:complete len:207 (+) Transcript_39284:1026-1646(+)
MYCRFRAHSVSVTSAPPRVPCISRPASSTHQHSSMDQWHCFGAKPPNSSHCGMKAPLSEVLFAVSAAWAQMRSCPHWFRMASQSSLENWSFAGPRSVPNTSCPAASLHQQLPVEGWHWYGAYVPSSRHRGTKAPRPWSSRSMASFWQESAGPTDATTEELQAARNASQDLASCSPSGASAGLGVPSHCPELGSTQPQRSPRHCKGA